MKKVWGWVAGIIVIVCILGLLIGVRAPQHRRGAVFVVVRGTTEQQEEAKAPRGNGVLVRRIPRP